MSAPGYAVRARTGLAELRKVAAFVRRDLLVLLSYRTALFSDWFGLLLQVAIFSFVARMVDPDVLPSFGGTRPSYLEFVAVGIGVGAFTQIGLSRVSAAVRQEQLMGTLDSVLAQPVGLGVVQFGSVAFDLLYTPLRIAAFLALSSVLFDLDLRAAGFGPAAAVTVVFLLVMWGVGVGAGAAVLTFRRGAGMVTATTLLASAASGAYFPVALLPAWSRGIVERNPIALELEGVRAAVLGEAGYADLLPILGQLAPMAVITLTLGFAALRAALRRELRRGTLSLY